MSIENTSSWLNRNYLADSANRVQFGNKLTLEGITGIQVVLKFLFLSVKHNIASLSYSKSWVYNNWDNIYDYWNKNHAEPLTQANMRMAILQYIEEQGIDDEQVMTMQTLEERDYLSKHTRLWNTRMPLLYGLMSGASSPSTDSLFKVQTNAYPYANPKVAHDGSLSVYLTDNDSDKIEQTEAAWAINNGNGFTNQGPITTGNKHKGYGDSNLQVAGEGDLIAAVWVRQMENIDKEPGDEMTYEDIMHMNNSTEIMAAIYDGDGWTTHRLTDNAHPNISPVVSVANGKVFVTYRSVYASNEHNPLDFSASDKIMHTVLDDGKWSEPEIIYNGTNGSVMGLSMASLTDGTTAIVYNVTQGEASEQTAGNEPNQIVYSVIDSSGNHVKNLQVTFDNDRKENPQITSIKMNDGTECFVIGWYKETELAAGVLENDIQLLAVNQDGEVDPSFVDSLSSLRRHQDVKFHPNFTFVKMPHANKSLQHLSILWKEVGTDLDEDANLVVTKDTLKSVKFNVDSMGAPYLSGIVDVATMPDYTEIDTIEAYTNDATGLNVHAMLLATTYTDELEEIGTIPLENGGEELPFFVSESISDMYSAKKTYQNDFNANHINFNHAEIIAGFDLPIQFYLVNEGFEQIEEVAITVDGQEETYSNLSLKPNNREVITYKYEVPTKITDINYTIVATYKDGEIKTKNGTLNLDIPDLGVASIDVDAVDGKRHMSIPVFNSNDTTLSNKGRVVKLGLYDNTKFDNDSLIGSVQTIGSTADLQLIDAGGYIANMSFDVQNYLATKGLTEIPDNGIMLYAQVWVEENGEKVAEFNESNNMVTVLIENLSVKYNEKKVLLTLEQTNTDEETVVDMTMQNMNMAAIPSGNVSVHLLDRDGNIIENKYIATTPEELLSFSAEEKITRQITFSQIGDAVEATFFEESADELDSSLSSLAIEGLELDFDPENLAYDVTARDLETVRLHAVASNRNATVTIMAGDGENDVIATNDGNVSTLLELESSAKGVNNKYTIVVEPVGAGQHTIYTLTIMNKQMYRN